MRWHHTMSCFFTAPHELHQQIEHSMKTDIIICWNCNLSLVLNFSLRRSSLYLVQSSQCNDFVLWFNTWRVYLCQNSSWEKSCKASGGKCSEIGVVKANIGSDCCWILLTIHGFGGYDTKSAVCIRCTIYSKMVNDSLPIKQCDVIQSPTATADDIGKVRIRLMLGSYGASWNSLLELCYLTNSMTLGNYFKPESLPPVESITQLHVLRAH